MFISNTFGHRLFPKIHTPPVVVEPAYGVAKIDVTQKFLVNCAHVLVLPIHILTYSTGVAAASALPVGNA
jgi:hypothetical protein